MEKIEFSKEQQEIISREFNNGTSLRVMGEMLGVHRSTVSRFLKEKGYTTEMRRKPTKYHCDDSVFEVIDTEEKAYWLGFISADGSVYERETSGSTLTINISQNDKHHLEKFRRFMVTNSEIKTMKGVGFNEGGTPTCRITINNTKVVNDLKKLGVVPNKSLTLKPANVPDELVRHYLRGYFDGDGSLYKSTGVWYMNVLGTMEMLDFFKDKMNIINKPHKRHKDKDTNNFSLGLAGGFAKPLELSRFLYEDATVFLNRKYEQYLLFEKENLERKQIILENSLN